LVDFVCFSMAFCWLWLMFVGFGLLLLFFNYVWRIFLIEFGWILVLFNCVLWSLVDVGWTLIDFVCCSMLFYWFWFWFDVGWFCLFFNCVLWMLTDSGWTLIDLVCFSMMSYLVWLILVGFWLILFVCHLRFIGFGRILVDFVFNWVYWFWRILVARAGFVWFSMLFYWLSWMLVRFWLIVFVFQWCFPDFDWLWLDFWLIFFVVLFLIGCDCSSIHFVCFSIVFYRWWLSHLCFIEFDSVSFDVWWLCLFQSCFIYWCWLMLVGFCFLFSNRVLLILIDSDLIMFFMFCLFSDLVLLSLIDLCWIWFDFVCLSIVFYWFR